MTDTSETELSRRAALAKLAKISAYTAPAVVTLLAPATSHAQSSTATMNVPVNTINNVCMALSNFPGELGNDSAGNWFSTANDTPGDCGS